LYEAEIVADVGKRTIDVFTGRSRRWLRPERNTLEGTPATPLLLESMTCAPPAGAGVLSVTVPVEDCRPPITVVGFSVSEETVGSGRGVTVSEADLLTPP